jgi:hypothetical protein
MGGKNSSCIVGEDSNSCVSRHGNTSLGSRSAKVATGSSYFDRREVTFGYVVPILNLKVGCGYDLDITARR